MTRSVQTWSLILRGLPAYRAASFLLGDLAAYPLPDSTDTEWRTDVARVEAFLIGFLKAQQQQEARP